MCARWPWIRHRFVTSDRRIRAPCGVETGVQMEREVERPPADLLAFYERSVGEVHAYAMRLTGGDRHAAEELVQDTFLTLVREMRPCLLYTSDAADE